MDLSSSWGHEHHPHLPPGSAQSPSSTHRELLGAEILPAPPAWETLPPAPGKEELHPAGCPWLWAAAAFRQGDGSGSSGDCSTSMILCFPAFPWAGGEQGLRWECGKAAAGRARSAAGHRTAQGGFCWQWRGATRTEASPPLPATAHGAPARPRRH